MIFKKVIDSAVSSYIKLIQSELKIEEQKNRSLTRQISYWKSRCEELENRMKKYYYSNSENDCLSCSYAREHSRRLFEQIFSQDSEIKKLRGELHKRKNKIDRLYSVIQRLESKLPPT